MDMTVVVMVVVATGRVVNMIIFLLKLLEVADDLSLAEGLAVSVVTVAQVGHPNALEGLKVLSCDGQDLLVEDPVDHISAGRVGQAALIVVEPFGLGLRGYGLRIVQGLEELVEADFVDFAKIVGSELLNEGVRVVIDLEEETNDSQSFIVFLVVSGSIDQLVDDVDFKIVLLIVDSVLSGAVHVHVVDLILVRALAVQVGNLDAAEVLSLQSDGP